MSDLHHPHDQFFKLLFSDIGAARVYMENFLPEKVAELLDLSTLRTTANTFLTEELSSSFADLIFECALKTDSGLKLWISFLYEHKSTPEEYALIQVGSYLMGAYSKQVKERKKPLQLVIPVLYYHGEKNWTPKNIPELFMHYREDYRVFAPDFQFIFQNLSLFSDQEIRNLEHNLLVPGLLMQKYFKNFTRLKEVLEEIFYALNELEEEGNYKENLYVYLFDVFSENKKEIMQRMKEFELTVDRSKNYIYQVKDEGREEGMKLAIRRLLKKGVDVSFISEALEVPKEDVSLIKNSLDAEK